MERRSFSSKTMLALVNGSLPRRESRSSCRRIRSTVVHCPHLVLLPPVQETKTPNRFRSRARLRVKTTAVLLTRLQQTQQTFRPRRWACGHVYVCMSIEKSLWLFERFNIGMLGLDGHWASKCSGEKKKDWLTFVYFHYLILFVLGFWVTLS